MEIRIGILNAPRELSFETDESVSDVEGKVSEALSGTGAALALTDNKGAQYLVPVAGIAYVQIGAEETRRVGFVA
ncbi:DUF3107 domain-containing protein [Gryllotalpicola protaetiae]|uniref:DUF3107 domain-containing protein n=1 Tax=Gryllotalpicola protaetiae TaxID=2419771 RepID=A0A387BIK7_9MICO|nr:DUF3107 domain-containing protein [Gryllotalpicola protaetiae]AYG02528.1 DUF3107 domain-containing protein [Gryllotalpicola protaetiae]